MMTSGEMRMMWIASVGIALLILGAMGINVLVHHDTSAAAPETTQSPTESPNWRWHSFDRLTDTGGHAQRPISLQARADAAAGVEHLRA